MNKDKKQLTLRELYKNALAGEEYKQELEEAEDRYRKAWWRAHTLPLLACVCLTAPVGVAGVLGLLDDEAMAAAPYALVASFAVLPFVVLLRRLELKVKSLGEQYDALERKPVDDDCVKRTAQERALLDSHFGIAHALVDDTTTAIVRSQHVLGAYGDRIGDAGRTKPLMLQLSGLLYDVTVVQKDLERLWKLGSQSELAVMDVGKRCATIARGTADCYDDVYTLVLND